jgi:hypothetical protein
LRDPLPWCLDTLSAVLYWASLFPTRCQNMVPSQEPFNVSCFK